MTSIVRSRQDRRGGLFSFAVVAALAGLMGACTAAQVVGGTGGSGGGAKGGNTAGDTGSNGGAGGSYTFTLPPAVDAGPDLPGGGHCGNGKLEGVEQCDDGNTASGDGCSQSCQIEANYDCPKAGELCTNLAVCGNGVLTSDEICDDGNTVAGDGCAANCQAIESGWVCPVPGKKCIPKCGDGVLTGSETCDDGNTEPKDGCSSTCQLEPGFDCPKAGQACIKSDCGNGKLEKGEQCDCGTDMKSLPTGCKAINGLFYGDGKGCSKTCTKEPSCLDSAGKTQACTPICGDGNIDATEECDDGNLADGDGCSSKCKKEGGFTCTTTTSADSSKDCPDTAATECLRMPMVYRDFKPENATGGHPDFYFLGTKAGTSTTPTTICVPNSGGPSKGNDSTARCWDITASDLLNGKPQYNSARANNTCACQFSEWSPGNSSRIPGGYTKADSPLVAGYVSAGTALSTTNPSGAATGQITGYTSTGGPIWKGTVPVVKDAKSFAQWFNDDATVNSTFTSVLEMPAIGTNLYQFASKNHLAGADNGFFPLDKLNPTQAILCDLWPYWNHGDGTPIWTTCQGDQYLFPPRVTDTDCGGNAAGGCWISNTPGVKHDSYFTTEARYFFAYDDKNGMSLQFYGDDDLFIFINGKLVLDLGGVHQQLPGKVTVSGNPGVASIIEGGCLDSTGAITGYTTATAKACSPTNGSPPAAVSPDDYRVRTVDLGLVPGSIYEIAIFGADRHPPESNYQLTLSGFTTTKSSCLPRCGDGVATAGEQCDCGDGTVPVPASCSGANDDTTYGGCRKDCTYGPFCGDGTVNGKEECDLGKQNGDTSLGKDGCTIGCLKPHFCGDKNVDPGEECDLGTNNGVKLDLTTRQPSDSPDAQILCNTDCTIPPGIVF